MSIDIQQELISHAQRELPNECCGYITGQGSALMQVYPMTNVDASPVHFSFEPTEQFKVIKDARTRQEVPVAVYHSHPESPARLSNEDLRLLNDPNMVYIIVSLEQHTPELKAYHVINGNITDVDIVYREGKK